MLAELLEDLEREVIPTLADLHLFTALYEAWVDFGRYGLPFGGGSLDQPENWRLAMECAHAAKAQADRELAEEEEAVRRLQ
jgi:hypothetical protein